MGTKIRLLGAALGADCCSRNAAHAQQYRRIAADRRRDVAASAAASRALRRSGDHRRGYRAFARAILAGYSVASGRDAGHQHLFGGTNGTERHGRSARLRRIRAIQRPHSGERPALPGFRFARLRFSTIPLNSIERIEITRGNSGTVLYGDGAIGGVINIVTKTASAAPFAGRVEGAIGSLRISRGPHLAAASSGPWSTSRLRQHCRLVRLSPEQRH